MKMQILSCAEAEFVEAFQYYNDQCPGLGFEFAAEIKKTIERVFSYPEAWHKLSERSRRCQVDRFPYGVIYQIRPDMILVVAVMHMKKDPVKWQGRI